MALTRLNRDDEALQFVDQLLKGREAELNLIILKAYLLEKLKIEDNDQIYLQKAEAMLGSTAIDNDQIEEFYEELRNLLDQRKEDEKIQLSEELDKMEEGFKIEPQKDSFMRFSGELKELNKGLEGGDKEISRNEEQVVYANLKDDADFAEPDEKGIITRKSQQTRKELL